MQTLTDLSTQLKALPKALQVQTTAKIANEIKADIINAFASQTDPITKAPWKPLKASTIKAKKRKNQGNKILRATGALADNWSIKTSPTKAIISNNAVSKSRYPYGLVHQYGNAKTPQRRFIPITGNIQNPVLSKDLQTLITKTIHQATTNHIKNKPNTQHP